MKHPQDIEMHEWVLHIREVQGLKKEGGEKARLAVVEQVIFKCQGMLEHGLNATHSMITDFIWENKLDTKNVGDILSKLQHQINHLQGQVYELQGQNYEYEFKFQRMSFAAGFRTPENFFSIYDGDSMP
ncbi:40S ribosomal protein S5-1 [Hordeum vulgare]|nr:40S ribosomal protein S5-1 [Hordeum vulgare]